jgi:PadR family transcriptional regulator AphA
MNLRHFILGLLAFQPMSGYDVKGYLENLDWLISSPSFGSVYPALHDLLEDDLVTVEIIHSQDRPARKVYTITEAGRRALRMEISEPLDSDASLREFVMRLMVADSLSHTGLIACLQQRRSQVAFHQAALEQAIEPRDRAVKQGKHLAFDFGLTAAMAEIAWLDSALERLSQERSLGEGVQEQQFRFDAVRNRRRFTLEDVDGR